MTGEEPRELVIESWLLNYQEEPAWQ